MAGSKIVVDVLAQCAVDGRPSPRDRRRAASRRRMSTRSSASLSSGASPGAPTRKKLQCSIPPASRYRMSRVPRGSTSGRSPPTSARPFHSALFERRSHGDLSCSNFFTSDRSSAIPITPVSEAAFPDGSTRIRESREWIEAVGFKAEPGTFAFLPGNDGRPERSARVARRGRAGLGLLRVADGAARGEVFSGAGDSDSSLHRCGARLGAGLVCVHAIQEAEALARDAGLARRRPIEPKSSGSRRGSFWRVT